MFIQIVILRASIGDPDQTPSSAASDLCLHCLHTCMSHKRTLGLYGLKTRVSKQLIRALYFILVIKFHCIRVDQRTEKIRKIC